MLRDFNKRSYMDTSDVKKETKFIKHKDAEFCSLIDEKFEEDKHKDPPQPIQQTLNELDNLMAEYFQLSGRLRYIRGRLYSLGIDPEKTGKNN